MTNSVAVDQVGEWHPQVASPETYPQVAAVVHPKFGKPDKVYSYCDSNGDVVTYVMRFESEEGKHILPYTYGHLRGVVGFHFKGP